MTWVVEEFLRTKESWHPGERGLRTLLSSVLHLPKPKAKDPIPVAPRRALSFQPSQGVLAAHFLSLEVSAHSMWEYGPSKQFSH